MSAQIISFASKKVESKFSFCKKPESQVNK